jgi:DNA-binding GntR family transcriptional regulator
MHVIERRPRELAADYALRVLEYNIQMLYMPPGSIIRENEIAERLGLSRTPVHEAVKVLAQSGLVHIAPKRATFVSLIDMDAHSQGKFAREALEPQLVHDLAGTLTEEQLASFQENLDSQRDAVERGAHPREILALDDEFHHMLYLARGMGHVWDSVHQVAAQFDRVRYFGMLLGYERIKVDEHDQLMEVLRDADASYDDVHEMIASNLNGYERFIDRLEADHPEYFLGPANYDTSRTTESDI